jgi:AraC family transcriptional regulator
VVSARLGRKVSSSLNKTSESLLDNSPDENDANAGFFERYTPHDGVVSRKVDALRAAFKGNDAIEDSWLEERLRELLAAMLASQQALKREVSTLSAVRASTRKELWQRINLARDYLHAHLAAPIAV